MRRTAAIILCALLVACGRGDDGAWLGYVEGDFLRLGPREAGTVTALAVREGDNVEAGAALFSIDAERAEFSVSEAEARVAAARARAADLERGGRPEEIAAAEQLMAQAQADLDLAQREYDRTAQLAAQDAAPRAQLDFDRRALESARARVTELQSRLDLIRQPARQDLIEAAQREVEAAEAERALAEEGLGDRAVAAPKAGRIDAVYLREGEYAGPGQPVLSLLPPENLKAVFFAPETELANLAVGDPVTVACDGCDGALSGVITHIGARAEFAPPVIYSEDARAKLVFRIEARAEPGQVWALNPGQPVQARLAE